MNSPIATNYTRVCNDIAAHAKKCGRNPSTITLVVVTKGYPIEHIRPLYDAGCRHFGENRIEEASDKIPQFPPDLNWHMIGTLQSKKISKVIGKYALIHSVDTLTLAEKIAKASEKEGITTHILLQANTSGEAAKHGLTLQEWEACYDQVAALPSLQIEGLMTMAPLTQDEATIRHCFSNLRKLKEKLGLKHLSMGMSQDYHIAIEEGATLLRIGTAVCQI